MNRDGIQSALFHYRTAFGRTIPCTQKQMGLRHIEEALALLACTDPNSQPRYWSPVANNPRNNDDRVAHLTRETISLLRQAQGKTQRGF